MWLSFEFCVENWLPMDEFRLLLCMSQRHNDPPHFLHILYLCIIAWITGWAWVGIFDFWPSQQYRFYTTVKRNWAGDLISPDELCCCVLLCPLFGARHGDQKDRGLTVRRGPWGLAELAEIVYQTNCEGVSSQKKTVKAYFVGYAVRPGKRTPSVVVWWSMLWKKLKLRSKSKEVSHDSQRLLCTIFIISATFGILNRFRQQPKLGSFFFPGARL